MWLSIYKRWTDFQTHSKQNSTVQPVVTVCVKCVRIVVDLLQTDFESKLKLFTQWLQIVPIQLIQLSAQALHSFKMKIRWNKFLQQIVQVITRFECNLGEICTNKFSKANQTVWTRRASATCMCMMTFKNCM